jgi:hypothetical protein
MKVINLWAGPGAGKSTTAAGLFLMKLTGRRVELVTEYAKEVVYDQDPTRIKNQLLRSPVVSMPAEPLAVAPARLPMPRSGR